MPSMGDSSLGPHSLGWPGCFPLVYGPEGVGGDAGNLQWLRWPVAGHRLCLGVDVEPQGRGTAHQRERLCLALVEAAAGVVVHDERFDLGDVLLGGQERQLGWVGGRGGCFDPTQSVSSQFLCRFWSGLIPRNSLSP